MKNIIKTFLVVMVVALALTVFTACNQPEAPDCDHNYKQEFLPGKDPTCTEDGLRPGYKCSNCGEVTKEQVVVPAFHRWVEADCTNPKTCALCEKTEGEALGHDMVEVAEKLGCSRAPGYSAHMDCTRCDYTEGKEELVVDHKFGEPYVGKEATCGEAGYYVIECEYCGGKGKGDEIPATGEHTWVDVEAKVPTCEEGGYTAHQVCETCGAKSEDYQELAPHNIGEDGICTGCGYVPVATAEELIAALEAGKKVLLTADIELDADTTITVTGEAVLDLVGHTITAVSDQIGSNRNAFDVRGTLTVKNGTITLEHKGENMAWDSSTNVFNVTAGGVLNVENATLKNLGGSDMAFVVHLNNWGEVTLNATKVDFESTYVAIRVFNSGNDMNNVTLTECVVKGVSAAFWVHNYTVADFNSAEKAEAHKALLNINIFDGTNTFEYDGKRAGAIRLGMTNSVYADAEGNHIHNFAIDVAEKAVTCTEAGYTAHKACDCGETEGKEEVPATGHTAGETATCTTAQECTVCYIELAPALAHTYVDGVCSCGAINVFKNQTLTPSEDAAGNYVNESWGYYPYSYLLDGDLTTRYSSKKSGGKAEAVISFDGIYKLNKYQILLNNYPSKGFDEFGTEIQLYALVDEEWQLAVDCKEADFNVIIIRDQYWLTFDMGDIETSAVKFVIPSSTSGWISFWEMQCSGELVEKFERVLIENILAGKTLTPSEDAAGNTPSWSTTLGYGNINDGNLATRYSSNKNGGISEATIELGAEYELSECKFLMFNDNGDQFSQLGTNIQIHVRVNGEWKTVVNCDEADFADKVVKVGDQNWLVFELAEDDGTAVVSDAIKFTIPGSRTGWVSIWEMYCSGYAK